MAQIITRSIGDDDDDVGESVGDSTRPVGMGLQMRLYDGGYRCEMVYEVEGRGRRPPRGDVDPTTTG